MARTLDTSKVIRYRYAVCFWACVMENKAGAVIQDAKKIFYKNINVIV